MRFGSGRETLKRRRGEEKISHAETQRRETLRGEEQNGLSARGRWLLALPVADSFTGRERCYWWWAVPKTVREDPDGVTRAAGFAVSVGVAPRAAVERWAACEVHDQQCDAVGDVDPVVGVAVAAQKGCVRFQATDQPVHDRSRCPRETVALNAVRVVAIDLTITVIVDIVSAVDLLAGGAPLPTGGNVSSS